MHKLCGKKKHINFEDKFKSNLYFIQPVLFKQTKDEIFVVFSEPVPHTNMEYTLYSSNNAILYRIKYQPDMKPRQMCFWSFVEIIRSFKKHIKTAGNDSFNLEV